MQPGEGKAQLGDTLSHTYTTLKGVPYQLYYCPCCLVLFKKVRDDEEPHAERD